MRSWSWKVGEVAGIGVYMHATFLLLIGWVALSNWLPGRSLQAAVAGVVFVLALFVCVVLHELGHALTARRYDIKTRDITLLPIGGVARLERMPDDPRQELWVALAGPAVSLATAAGLFLVVLLTAGLEPLTQLSVAAGSFLGRLMMVNLFLALFNMIPAFPMDGGRVLRSLLALRLEYTQATQLAASLGQAIAFLFGLLGLFTNPFLVFIALFVWLGAQQEAGMVQMKSALGGIPVSKAMLTYVQTLTPQDTLGRAVESILAGSQQDFPVVDDSRVVGVLTRRDLMVALARFGQEGLVSDVMQRDFQVVDSSDMLETASMRLQECGCHTLPVTHGGQLVGLVTMDNVGEFLMIQSALASAQRARA
ncbi:MAG: site-2 protease family protein [Acidobacteria bacterium]|nr:site-2 protease family protein [Acidobacteriota bacterium]